jgi:thiol-disulfide isomerase/thioredoxin
MPNKAPNIFGADILGGPAFNLSDHKGSFVVVSMMGLPWCEPCKVEMPHLAAVAEEYAVDPSLPNVHFVIVNWKDTFGNDGIIAYAKQENFTIPIIDDAKGQIMQAYGVGGVPRTFVIKPQGDLCDVILASFSADTLPWVKDHCGMPAPGEGITYDLKSQPPVVVVVNPSFTGLTRKDIPVPIPFTGPDPKPLSLMSRQVLRALALHDGAATLPTQDARAQVRSAALDVAARGVRRMQSVATLERELGPAPRPVPLPNRKGKAGS